jgi:AraC-like DNA-binding protein
LTLAVFARPESARHLREALSDWDVLFADSWSALESSLAEKPIRAVLLDPGFGAARDNARVSALQRQHPLVPLIAYARMDAESFAAIARLARDGPELAEVLVQDTDRRDERLLAVVERANAHPLAVEILGALEPAIGRLPYHVSQALLDVFTRPNRYARARELAIEGKTAIQTLHRLLEKAELGTPKRILTIAKLCRGYCLLRNTASSIKAVAQRVGYDRTSTFSENCLDILGCTPSQLRRTGDPNLVCLALLEWLYKPTRSKAERMISRQAPPDIVRASRPASRTSTL